MQMQDVLQGLAWIMHQVPRPITMQILTVIGIFLKHMSFSDLTIFFCFSFLTSLDWLRLGRGPTGYGTGAGSSRAAASSLYGRSQGLSYPGGTLLISYSFVPALRWTMLCQCRCSLVFY
jgi:hypothetical protein